MEEASASAKVHFRPIFLKWVQSLAWATRSRLDLCCAVAHKQTNCASPRVVDIYDLEHMVGYLVRRCRMGNPLGP